MRAFIIALLFALTTFGARAQVEYIDPALRAANLVTNLSRLRVEVREHLVRLERLEQFSVELSDIIDDVSSIETNVSEIENLVRYADLDRRSMANLSRLESYLMHCATAGSDSFCTRELEDLMSAARSVSAEARELEANSISIAIVASTQELDLLLSDVSGSAVWKNVTRSEYDAYWDAVLGSHRDSLTQRLNKLEAQQRNAITNGFGVSFHGAAVASIAEFGEFKNWVTSVGGPALTAQKNTGRVIFDLTLSGAIFGKVQEVDTIRKGRKVSRIDPVISIKVYEGGAENHNEAIVQGPGINTFEFWFETRVEETTFSNKTELQNPMSVLTGSKCRMFRGGSDAIGVKMYNDAADVLEPLETDINRPA